MRFRTYYDNNYVDEGTTFEENSSLTDQSFKCMTNVNYLIEHMAGTNRTPIYGIQDNATFEDWSNEMAMVKRRYMLLDEETQRMFGNAQKFLTWCSDPENYAEELPLLKELKLKKDRDLLKQQKDDEYQQKKAELIAKAIKKEG